MISLKVSMPCLAHTKNCPIKLITFNVYGRRNWYDVRKIDEISNSHFNFSSNRWVLILICVMLKLLCAADTACVIQASPAEKNWRKKMEIVSAWKWVGEKRIKEGRETSTNERGENLFYSDSMETINYRWYTEWYTLNIPWDCYAKARSTMILIYCTRFPSFRIAFPKLSAFSFCSLCVLLTPEIETVKIYCAVLWFEGDVNENFRMR